MIDKNNYKFLFIFYFKLLTSAPVISLHMDRVNLVIWAPGQLLLFVVGSCPIMFLFVNTVSDNQ